jgi:molecular chaperone DnaK
VMEAETNGVADKAQRAFVETKNQADAMIHQVEKTMAEHGRSMPKADIEEANAAVSATRAAAEGKSHDELTQKMERLAEIAKKIDAIAANAATGSGQSTQQPHSANRDQSKEAGSDVVDAEFEDVSGNKG